MTLWRRTSLVLVALFLTPAHVRSDDRSSEPTPDQLVEQLGDARFIQRQIATEALTEIGLPALNAVRKGTEHADPEVRFRSRQILRAIRHLERQRLISAFIAGLDVETANELPGFFFFFASLLASTGTISMMCSSCACRTASSRLPSPFVSPIA